MPQKKKQVKTIQEAKVEVREKIGKLFHDAKQAHRQYSYTSHNAVTAAVVPAMHDVGMTHKFICENLQIVNDFAIMDISVTFLFEDQFDMCVVYAADRLRDGTSMGAIISYGLKVAMLKYFGLESGEKDLEAIQAEQETAKAAVLSQQAAEKKAEIDKAKAEAIVDNMEAPWEENPTDPAYKDEKIQSDLWQTALTDFCNACNEMGIDNEALEKRIAADGYKSLDDIPIEVLDQWTHAMEKKLMIDDAKENGIKENDGD